MKPTRLFNRNFTLLFQGQLLSNIGSAAYSLALLFWLKQATGSATIMGLFAMFSLLPALVLGPLGGTFADHFSRKKIIIYGDLVNGVMITSVGCLMWFFPEQVDLTVSMLFVSSVLNGIVMSVFRPAVGAMLPDLVPPHRLMLANGLLQNSAMITMAVGQFLGGVLFRVLGAPVLLLANGIGYLLSALSECFIEAPPRRVEPDTPWRELMQKFKNDTLDGFRFVQRLPGLKSLILLMALMTFFMGPMGVLLPFYVEDILGASVDWFGFMMAGLALGALLGGLVASTLPLKPERRGAVVILCFVMVSFIYGSLAYIEVPALACLMLAIMGLAEGGMGVYITAAIQLNTPSSIRGRVLGVMGTLTMAMAPVSLGITGVAIDLVDKNIGYIFLFCGAGMLLVSPFFVMGQAFHRVLAVEVAAEEGADEQR